jgi:hypothetical protein
MLFDIVEITTGGVLVQHNSLLCHSDTVLWEDILADSGAPRELDNHANLAQHQRPHCMLFRD